MNEQDKARAGRLMPAAKVGGLLTELAAQIYREASGMTAAMSGDTITLSHSDGSSMTITFYEEGGAR